MKYILSLVACCLALILISEPTQSEKKIVSADEEIISKRAGSPGKKTTRDNGKEVSLLIVDHLK